MPFELLGLDHVVLRVTDLARSTAFYCGALGCSRERELPEIGLYQLRAGAHLIDLVLVDSPLGRAGGAGPGTEARNVDHFALAIDRFDEAELRAHLEANGIVPGEVGVRYGAKGQGPSMYIQDPDGNVVELKGPSALP
jgi:glyoxylase I family protein